MTDPILITHKEVNPDGSVTLYGIRPNGQRLVGTFPAEATVDLLVCPTCATPLAGDEWCPKCLTPEQITNDDRK